MSRLPVLLAAALVLAPIALAQEPDLASELQRLRERIDEIEELQVETSERFGDRALVQAFSAKSFDLGGHVTNVFSAIRGKNGTEVGHLVSLIELFAKAELSDGWSLFASPGFYTFNGGLLDDPSTATAGDPAFIEDNSTTENIFLSRIYGEWSPSDRLRLQGGIIGSPHGTTNREYFIPSRTIAAGNLHTRVFLANQLYPQYLAGIKASGKVLVGDTDWVEYDAYFGSESESAADDISGARIGYAFGDIGLTIACNYGMGTRQASTMPLTNIGLLQSPFNSTVSLTRDYRMCGIDIDWRSGPCMFKGEAYYSAEKGLKDQRALTAEATYFVTPQWGVSYRYDYYDPGADLNLFLPVPAVQTLGQATEHVLGVAYDPYPSVRLRLDFHHTNLPNTPNTAQFVNLSWSLSF